MRPPEDRRVLTHGSGDHVHGRSHGGQCRDRHADVREAVRLEAADVGSVASGRSDDAVGAALGGTVLKAAYLGSHMEYTVDSDIGELFVLDPRVANPLPVGARVTISFDDHGVAVVG